MCKSDGETEKAMSEAERERKIVEDEQVISSTKCSRGGLSHYCEGQSNNGICDNLLRREVKNAGK